MYGDLRKFIRILLEEKDVIGEPDLSAEDEREEDNDNSEQSVTANIAGVTTPLGTGPTYPSTRAKKRKRRSPAQAAGSAFGNAKPVKNV